MSSISHEKARLAKSRGSEEEFVLFLQGIPARCRWQELKDLVRQTALHIRQAVVYDDHHGFPTGLGQIIVKNEEEAWRTYRRLSTNGWEGQSLVVTLARTSSPTQPIAGPTKSPTCVFQSGFPAGYSPPSISRNMAIPPSPMSSESHIPPSPINQSSDYAVFVSHQPFMPAFIDPLAVPNPPTMQPSFCDPMGFGLVPTYSTSHPMHQPVIANSFSPTHFSTTPRKSLYNHTTNFSSTYPRQNLRRSVVIQNLNPATTDEDLYTFLQGAVHVDHCELQPIHTGFGAQQTRNRTYARVTLCSAEEAKRAVAVFNNTIFMRFRIRVKIDRTPPHMSSYNPPPDQYVPFQRDPSASTSKADHMQFILPTTESSNSDTEELKQRHEAPKYSDAELSPKSERGPIDSCQPLVVNGSSTGGRTAVAV
ncbi:RNA-binding protein [Aspergillus undulatus]|uniref:RNA-binding protein n=1 Tax=Aspergillus undulatus TaxID=1810928 RepID=UPI003CCCA1DC